MPTIRSSSAAGARGPLLHPLVDLEHLADLPDVVDRVQAALRLLEDHADPLPRSRRRSGRASAGPRRRTGSARPRPTRRCHQAQDGQGADRLAAAGLADQAQDLAAVDVEVDPGHRADDAVGCGTRSGGRGRRAAAARRADPPRDLGDLGDTAAGHRFRRGSSASRRPSPNRLKPSTLMVSAMPGARMSHGALNSLAVEGDHRAPLGQRRLGAEAEERQGGDLEDGAGHAQRAGHDERRQRVREDAAEQDPAPDSPSAREAVTKSRSRTDRTDARMIRA